MKIIIGGSGYIGSNLCRHFSKKSELLIGTYYHNRGEGLEYFDLLNPDLTKLRLNLKNVSHAIICSGMSKIDECKKREEESYRVNVTGTKKIILHCFNLGIIPVFFSSDYVFNGEKGNYTEEDETNPCTVYGTHKKIIEDFLLSSEKPFLIARLSKIFGLTLRDNTMLTSWAEQLKNNDSVRCATDQRISATYIEDLVQVLDIAMQKNLVGLYNLASPESYSRFEMAMMLKKQLGINTGQIVPCSIKDFKFLETRALDTSLNVEKILRETNFKFAEMRACISKLEEILRV